MDPFLDLYRTERPMSKLFRLTLAFVAATATSYASLGHSSSVKLNTDVRTGEVLAMSRSVLVFDAVAFKLPPGSEYAGSVYLAERCS
jgi:hypothetical protein